MGTGEDEFKECSLFLVQYVPDPVKGETLNIGILLHNPDEEYLGCLFTRDFRRVKQFHAQADLDLLRELQEDFEKQIDEHGDELSNYLTYIQKTFSNLIQIGSPRTCLLRDPQSELADVFARYVGMLKPTEAREESRLEIKQRLTSAFKRANVWDRLEKRVPAARWTQPGDPLRLDYGYRPLFIEGKPNGHARFIHALSLKHDEKLAKVLVYTIERVRRKEPADLTAVVERLPERGDKTAAVSHRILQDGNILVRPLAEVDELAGAIRGELGI
ncbi:MAG: hypothetical protein DMG21_00605 [Acidobacteria bacterium]|nr:MAG: hypothetical protein DMG21_00605 [Acidobacteriota bacterium]